MPDYLLAIVVEEETEENARKLLAAVGSYAAQPEMGPAHKVKRIWTEPYSGTLADRIAELEGMVAKRDEEIAELRAHPVQVIHPDQLPKA